jgi:urease subunit beta
MADPERIEVEAGEIELNANRTKKMLKITNTGDRAIQVGSHFHLFEANRALQFDRVAALGMHLDLAAGTAVRFEPGDTHDVQACAYGGLGFIAGFNGLVQGSLRARDNRSRAIAQLRELGFLEGPDGNAGKDSGAKAGKKKGKQKGNR